MNISVYLNRLPKISLQFSGVISFCLVFAAFAAYWMTPHLTEVTSVHSLEDAVPRQFGDWKEISNPYIQVSLSTGTDPNMDQPYDQVVMRSYVNSQGNRVMLALAWGKRQRQEVKIHRPDLCYIAQGFKIESLDTITFSGIKSDNGGDIVGKHMYAENGRTGEAVSYWMRIGSFYSEDAFATRFYILKEGLSGRIPDGILVRASMHLSDASQEQVAWPLLDSFLVELVKSVPPEARVLLLGASDSASLTYDK